MEDAARINLAELRARPIGNDEHVLIPTSTLLALIDVAEAALRVASTDNATDRDYELDDLLAALARFR